MTEAPKRSVRKVAEQPVVEPIGEMVIGEAVPQRAVFDVAAERYAAGWAAALKEVESQWNQGHDMLARFLATQKRDRA